MLYMTCQTVKDIAVPDRPPAPYRYAHTHAIGAQLSVIVDNWCVAIGHGERLSHYGTSTGIQSGCTACVPSAAHTADILPEEPANIESFVALEFTQETPQSIWSKDVA